MAPRNESTPAAAREEPDARNGGAARPRGRPRVHASAAERYREHGRRRRERQALLAELLHAARNAHWEDAEVERVANHGDDEELMRALTAHYQARHWMRWRRASEEKGTE